METNTERPLLEVAAAAQLPALVLGTSAPPLHGPTSVAVAGTIAEVVAVAAADTAAAEEAG